MKRKLVDIAPTIFPELCVLTLFIGISLSHVPNAPPEPFASWRNSFLLDKPPESRPLQVPTQDTTVQSEIEMEGALSSQASLYQKSRNPKFFPYFLVQFTNDPCSNVAGTQHGICVSAKDCRSGRGTAIGICAQGFGTCCRYVKSCGNEGGDIQIRENSTEIRAGNGSSSCRFILHKTRGICQVRLDMLKFEFGKAKDNGDCSDTKLDITGSTVGFPNLCGNLTGQHLYLHYGNGDKIYIKSGESTSPSDTYSIRVSYIRCDSRQLVPSHCSQHLTGAVGEIRSFNWPHQQLNSQEYTICVADPQNGYNSNARRGRKMHRHSIQRIQWTTCGHHVKGSKDFFISGRLGSPRKFSNPEHCDTKDYVQMFGGHKQCGNVFRNETLSSVPFLVHVRFDEKERSDLSTLLSQGQGHNAVVVGKPEKGCASLDTDETKCVENQANVFCNCTRTLKRHNSKMEPTEYEDDEGNTGFCLTYRITA